MERLAGTKIRWATTVGYASYTPLPDFAITHDFIAWVHGRADKVKVLEPSELQKFVVDKVKDIKRKYA
jgi:hypothetical protein